MVALGVRPEMFRSARRHALQLDELAEDQGKRLPARGGLGPCRSDRVLSPRHRSNDPTLLLLDFDLEFGKFLAKSLGLTPAFRLDLDEPQDDVAVALAGPAHGPESLEDGRLDPDQALDKAELNVTATLDVADRIIARWKMRLAELNEQDPLPKVIEGKVIDVTPE